MKIKFQKIAATVAVLICFISSNVYAAALMLTTSSGDFDTIILEGNSSPTVGIIFINGRGQPVDGAVVSELRISMNNSGYTTLAFANAEPAAGTTFADYVADAESGTSTVFPEMHERIQAALAHFEGLGIQQVIIAGFSLGARFASEFVARETSDVDIDIVGLVGLGMYSMQSTTPGEIDYAPDALNLVTTLDEVDLPVLDIYGDNDFFADDATDRPNAYVNGGGQPANYTQTELDCPDAVIGLDCHVFGDSDDGLKGSDDSPLETAVRDWIEDLAPLSTPLPEPGTLMLMLVGLLGLGVRHYKTK